MSSIEIVELLYPNHVQYKGLKILIECLDNIPLFKENLFDALIEGKISAFSDELFDKLDSLNINGKGVFTDIFREGTNLGACTIASKYLSYVFDDVRIAGGINKYLIGTKNSDAGEHTWVETPDGKIYDTTFMLVIDKQFAKELGYTKENEYDPNKDIRYAASKNFARDKSIKK